MSIVATVIGVGAAGNKAAINIVEKKIISSEYVKLLNTTGMDIPDKYKNNGDLFMLFGSSFGGAGKEASKGRAYMIKAIQDKQIVPENLLNDDANEVILVTSAEGGSGSGSCRVLAKYFDSMNIPVHVFVFIGFADEIRGINNTLNCFKDLPANVILHTICNSHFLDYTQNYSKAEAAANDEFAREVEILLGHKLQPSKQNIDQMDLYKINTQPGYCIINHVLLNGIKNVEGFNAAVAKVFENACYMDNDNSAKRIAVMINATKKTQECIDNSYEVIKRYVGVPIETFQHIQPDDDNDVEEEYIDIIACGMNYPERAIKDMNTKYVKLKEKLNTSRKSFEDIYSGIDLGDDEVDTFNMNIKRKNKAANLEDLFGSDINAEISTDSFYGDDDEKVVIPSPMQKPKSTETPVNIGDLKSHKFVNTTVNQSVYAPDYSDMDIDVDDEYISNPMQVRTNVDDGYTNNPMSSR